MSRKRLRIEWRSVEGRPDETAKYCNDDATNTREETPRSKGINPSSFHNKLRSLDTALAHPKNCNRGKCCKSNQHEKEKRVPQHLQQLYHILATASRNVVLQKRKEHTSVQNLRREAYHELTELKMFPLQELAMHSLDALMSDYLGLEKTDLPNVAIGDGKPRVGTGISENEVEKPLQSFDCQKISTISTACGVVSQNEIPLTSAKSNSKDNQNKGTTCENLIHHRNQNPVDPKRKYKNDFLSEKWYRPRLQVNNISWEDASVQISTSPLPTNQFNFLPVLWSMEPRIFALEISSTGKRKYIVGHLGRFLQYYWRDCNPLSRHYYELIREGTPCRMYFDLEFCKKSNPDISFKESETLMTEFINELCTEFQLVYGISIERNCILDLDSSTDKKFSRHLIVHLPNGALFEDARAAGTFAKNLVGRLADEVATGVLMERHSTLAKYLFVNVQSNWNKTCVPLTGGAIETNCSQSLNTSLKTMDQNREKFVAIPEKKVTCFVDLGVYTRNRLFRLMGSHKFGKRQSAALRIAASNQFSFPSGFDNSKFYHVDQKVGISQPAKELVASTESCELDQNDTIINIGQQLPDLIHDHDEFCAAMDWESHADALSLTLVVPANSSKMAFPILQTPGDDSKSAEIISSQHPTSATSLSLIAQRPKFKSEASRGTSPIPMLDNFITNILGRRGGSQGRIRAWSIEQSSRRGKPDTYLLTFQMCENRFCENIGREHKSNNIMWTVDLTEKFCWQTCHDPDCRAAGFHGRPLKLPDDILSEIDDYLLEQELAHFDESKILHQARAASQSPNELDIDDSELDKELYELDVTSLLSTRALANNKK